MRIVSLITIAAFSSFALHVSIEHGLTVSGEFSTGHHGEGATEGEHNSYEPSDNTPLDDDFGTHQHGATLIPTKSRASVQHAPLILAHYVSSIPDRDRTAFQDYPYSPAPHSDNVALHLSACVFLL